MYGSFNFFYHPVVDQSVPAGRAQLRSYILIGNRVRVKSSGLAPGLANALPPGLARRANALQ